MKRGKLSITLLALISLIVSTASLKAATYYYKTTATTNPALNTNWTTSSTGIGGTTPTAAQFNAINNTLNFYNSTAAVSATVIANWTTLGSGTVINIGAAAKTASMDFSTFTINRQVNVGANGTVLSSNANPTFMGSGQFIYNVASNATMSANGVTVPPLTFGAGYGNLTLSGTSATLGGVIIVNGAFSGNAIVFNGQQLNLNGSVTALGALTGDANAVLNFVNAGNVTLTMDAVNNSMNTLTYDDGGAGTTLSLTNALNIAPTGVITPVSGTIDITTMGGSLTLVADQAVVGNTGSIGPITGVLVATAITSQVYHDPAGNQTDWTLMGSPGITGQDFTQWNASFPITCANCPDGYAPGGTNFGSITDYVEATDGYTEISNTTDAMTIGQGWWVYMGNSSPGTATAGELITVSGPPNMVSPFTFPVTAGGVGGGYNLVANPYPSPISWTSVQGNNAANIGTSYYTWSANSGAHSSYDALSGLSNPLSGSYALSDVIPTGMGIYVLASAGPTISFSEADKAQGTQALLRQSHNNVQKVLTPALSIQASGNGMTSEAVIGFLSAATAGFDPQGDTKRFGTNPGQLELSTVVGGFNLAINCMPDLTQNYSIPVRMITGTTGTYAINGLNLNRMPIGACLILHDNYTNSDYDLRQGPYNITLTDTETVARFVLNITTTSLAITTNATPATCVTTNNGYLTAIGNNSGPWNYTWKNANNVIVRTSTNIATADSLKGLNNGVYSVDVNTVGTCDDAMQTFTLTVPAAATSAFTMSSATVNVSSNVTFTDNSTNTNSYWWDFGDGNTSSLQSPVYAYSNIGTFDVTFYAINSNCADTAVSFQSIDVVATTGITSAMHDDIVISKDQSGSYIKFNYSGQNKVNINVYNALGQVLLSNANLSVASDKIYLNIDNAKDQMIFVSISNLDKNTQLTKKLYNN